MTIGCIPFSTSCLALIFSILTITELLQAAGEGFETQHGLYCFDCSFQIYYINDELLFSMY